MSGAAPDAAARPGYGAMRAEWVKFRTLPSNTVTACVALTVIVALSAILVVSRSGEGETTTTTELLAGVSWAQLLLAVLAVVAVCTEWTSGTNTSTFLAVPTRWPVLAGKTAVVGAVAFAAGAAGAAGALVAGATAGIDVGAEPALAVRLVVGTGLYLGTIAMLSVGIGAIVRNLVGGIITAVALLAAAPLVVGLIPIPEVQRLALYLPAPAGGMLLGPAGASAELTPWGGYAILAGWAAAALAGAALTLRARDV